MVGTARHRLRPTRTPVRRAAAVLGLLLAIVAIAVAGTLFALSERLGDDVVRVPDPFTAIDPATRPARTSLLVGIDARSAEPTTGDAAKQAFVASVQRGDAALWVALRDGSPAAYAEQHLEALLGPAPAGEERP